MKNPFPGMNPFLEQRWSDFHISYIVSLSDSLRPNLPEDLEVCIKNKWNSAARCRRYDLIQQVAKPTSMQTGIDPKVDFAFKRVFGCPENSDVLKHLLNSVLEGSRPRLEYVEVLNPFSQKDGLADRLIVLDIRAKDAAGHEYLIEMQMDVHASFAERLVFYGAKAYSQQLSQGEGYDQLRPVTVICFLNAILFPKADGYHGCYELMETATHRRFSDHWQIHVIELPKFQRETVELGMDIERWAYFLKHGDKLDPQSLPPLLTVPEIVRATETLTMLAHTESERDLYEARLKFQRDEQARLKYSEERGMQRGLEQGEVLRSRKTLLRLGQIRFGAVPESVSNLVNAIEDVNRLESLTDQLLDAADWQALFPAI